MNKNEQRAFERARTLFYLTVMPKPKARWQYLQDEMTFKFFWEAGTSYECRRKEAP